MTHTTTLEVMRELIEFKDALLKEKQFAFEKLQCAVLVKLNTIETDLIERHQITPEVVTALRDIRRLMLS